MSDLLSVEIHRLTAAANALGAPLFGLDLLARGAALAEAGKLDAAGNQPGETDNPFAAFLPNEDEVRIDADIAVLRAAARAAWAFVAQRYLPSTIAAPLRGDLEGGLGHDLNEALIAGYGIAKRYGAKA